MKSRKSRSSRWLLLLALPLVLACHPRPSSAPTSLPDAAAWSATYRCRLTGPDDRRSFRIAVLVQRPDRFRLELYGPVGGARLLVASDGEILGAAVPGDRLYGSDRATAAAFGSLLGLSVEAAELLDLLEGRRAARGAGEGVEIPPVEGNGPSLRVVYGPLVETDVGPLPGEIQVVGGGQELSLRLKAARARQPDPASFHLAAPPGFRTVSLDALSRTGIRLFGSPEEGPPDSREPSSPVPRSR